MPQAFDIVRRLNNLGQTRREQLSKERTVDEALLLHTNGCEEICANYFLMCRALNRAHCRSVQQSSWRTYPTVILHNMNEMSEVLAATEEAIQAGDTCARLNELISRFAPEHSTGYPDRHY